ncbi:MAG: LuxR C-terminal-related transcriptional regulator [Bacteroidota bacterium]|nr:LuxR C-terminal-related transcriptional regulator [Bacteroidota bacterium]
MSGISYVIACKSYIVYAGMERIIGSIPGAEELTLISDEKSMQKQINKINPDFLIINAKMLEDPHKNVRNLFKRSLKSKIILITGDRRKNEQFSYFDEHICMTDQKEEIVERLSKLVQELPKDKVFQSELTDREREVLREVALGKTNKEIAESLFISIHTVITHRKNITKKIDIRTASGMTAYAILNKIIDLEDIDLQ